MIKSILVLVACLYPTLLPGGDCEINLDDVLERYLEARGGLQALNQQHSLRLVSTNHEGRWNPKYDYRVMKPGYMWITAIYDDGETVIEGFDGQRGWEKWGDKPAGYVSGDAARGLNQGAQSPVHLYGLNHMEQLGARVTFEGCRKLDGQHFYVIKVVSRFGTDIDYFINQENFQLERSRSKRPLHPTQDPTPIIIEERWDDFRFVNGVLHPFAFSQWNVESGERLNWLEVHQIEQIELTPEFFAIPNP